MARTVDLHPGAAADAADMAEWYRRRSPPVAAALAAEILEALDQIEESPLTFPPHTHGTRRFVIDRFHCDAVYRVRDEQILILAIAAHKRRPGYWAQRL